MKREDVVRDAETEVSDHAFTLHVFTFCALRFKPHGYLVAPNPRLGVQWTYDTTGHGSVTRCCYGSQSYSGNLFVRRGLGTR